MPHFTQKGFELTNRKWNAIASKNDCKRKEKKGVTKMNLAVRLRRAHCVPWPLVSGRCRYAVDRGPGHSDAWVEVGVFMESQRVAAETGPGEGDITPRVRCVGCRVRRLKPEHREPWLRSMRQVTDQSPDEHPGQ